MKRSVKSATWNIMRNAWKACLTSRTTNFGAFLSHYLRKGKVTTYGKRIIE